MSSLIDLVAMDNWRKFTFCTLVALLGFILVLASKMTGDAWGFLMGTTVGALVAAEVGSSAVKQNAITKQTIATAGTTP